MSWKNGPGTGRYNTTRSRGVRCPQNKGGAPLGQIFRVPPTNLSTNARNDSRKYFLHDFLPEFWFTNLWDKVSHSDGERSNRPNHGSTSSFPSLLDFIVSINTPAMVTPLVVCVMWSTKTLPPLVACSGSDDGDDEKYLPHHSETPYKWGDVISNIGRTEGRNIL